MVATFLNTLAAELDRSWRRLEYDEHRFADVARDCLARANPSAALDGAALLAFAAEPQVETRAQHPAEGVLPLYRGHRFDIHAHFWFDEIAPPHDHGWAGAFHIIEGRSLNGYHGFTQTERVRDSLRLGQLRCDQLLVHAAGDTIAVRPGPDFIHSVHYLGRPGVAISVRNRLRERGSTTYFRPGLALSDRANGDELRCRLRALSIARELDHDHFVAVFERLVRAGDRVTTFLALSQATQEDWPVPPRIFEAGREVHGAGFETLELALDDLRRYQQVVDLRRETRDPTLLAFLAALYASDDRRELLGALDMLGLFEGGAALADPWLRVGGWLVELLIDDDDGGVAIPDWLPGALGRLAAGEGVASIRDDLGGGVGAVAEGQLALLDSVSAALREAVVYACLGRA